jgi:hypothetical protein
VSVSVVPAARNGHAMFRSPGRPGTAGEESDGDAIAIACSLVTSNVVESATVLLGGLLVRLGRWLPTLDLLGACELDRWLILGVGLADDEGFDRTHGPVVVQRHPDVAGFHPVAFQTLHEDRGGLVIVQSGVPACGDGDESDDDGDASETLHGSSRRTDTHTGFTSDASKAPTARIWAASTTDRPPTLEGVDLGSVDA